MCFDKNGSHADGNCRPSQNRRKLALPTGTSAQAARLLNRVRGIENNRTTGISGHLRQAAHIGYQRVIAETGSAFGDADICITGINRFLTMFSYPTEPRTALFNVNDFAGFGCGHDQVGLTAQKGRNLQHINMRSDYLTLFPFVNVGDNRAAV